MRKLKVMLCVMMLPWSINRLHQNDLIDQSIDHHRLRRGWNATLPPTGRHLRTGLSPSEADHYEMWNQIILMERCRWSCPYRWATQPPDMSNTRFQPRYKYKVIKPEQSICRYLWSFCFNNISPHKFCCVSFFCPVPEAEKWWSDGFLWCYCFRFVSSDTSVGIL